jgi:hypothetical protein
MHPARARRTLIVPNPTARSRTADGALYQEGTRTGEMTRDGTLE